MRRKRERSRKQKKIEFLAAKKIQTCWQNFVNRKRSKALIVILSYLRWYNNYCAIASAKWAAAVIARFANKYSKIWKSKRQIDINMYNITNEMETFPDKESEYDDISVKWSEGICERMWQSRQEKAPPTIDDMSFQDYDAFVSSDGIVNDDNMNHDDNNEEIDREEDSSSFFVTAIAPNDRNDRIPVGKSSNASQSTIAPPMRVAACHVPSMPESYQYKLGASKETLIVASAGHSTSSNNTQVTMERKNQSNNDKMVSQDSQSKKYGEKKSTKSPDKDAKPWKNPPPSIEPANTKPIIGLQKNPKHMEESSNSSTGINSAVEELHRKKLKQMEEERIRRLQWIEKVR